MKFAPGRSLTVNGDLVAEGEAGNPVVFTAYSDDSVGGDSNGDGPSSGSPGYWNYIRFNDTVDADVSRLEHVEVRYGGSTGSVYLSGSSLAVVSSVIRDSGGGGMYLYNSSSRIEGTQVLNSAGPGIRIGYDSASVTSLELVGNTLTGNTDGIRNEDCSDVVTIVDNTITGNSGYGIYFEYGYADTPELEGNTVTGNQQPARLPFSVLPGPGDGNTLTGNTRDHIEVLGNTLSRPLTLVPGVYWQVSGTATVAAGINLTAQPGVVWKFGTGSGWTVNGALTAIGAADNEILFTSYRDDSAGGDTNGDGPSVGQPGDWHTCSLTTRWWIS